MTDYLKSVILRFLRVFISGAVANMVVFTTTNSSNLGDAKAWAWALCVAAITGGLAALDKALRYQA